MKPTSLDQKKHQWENLQNVNDVSKFIALRQYYQLYHFLGFNDYTMVYSESE